MEQRRFLEKDHGPASAAEAQARPELAAYNGLNGGRFFKWYEPGHFLQELRRRGAERSRRQRRRSSAVHSSAVQSAAVAGSTLNLERARLHRLEKRLERALIDPAGTLATLVPSLVHPSLVSKLLEH